MKFVVWLMLFLCLCRIIVDLEGCLSTQIFLIKGQTIFVYSVTVQKDMAIDLFNTLQSNYFIEECIRETLNNLTATYCRIRNVGSTSRIGSMHYVAVDVDEIFQDPRVSSRINDIPLSFPYENRTLYMSHFIRWIPGYYITSCYHRY